MGHSLNFTRAISNRQIRSAFPQAPNGQCTVVHRVHSVGFGRTAAADLSAARPFPCRLEILYPVGSAVPNRGPHRPVRRPESRTSAAAGLFPPVDFRPRGPGRLRSPIRVRTAQSNFRGVRPPRQLVCSHPWTLVPGPQRKLRRALRHRQTREPRPGSHRRDVHRTGDRAGRHRGPTPSTGPKGGDPRRPQGGPEKETRELETGSWRPGTGHPGPGHPGKLNQARPAKDEPTRTRATINPTRPGPANEPTRTAPADETHADARPEREPTAVAAATPDRQERTPTAPARPRRTSACPCAAPGTAPAATPTTAPRRPRRSPARC